MASTFWSWRTHLPTSGKILQSHDDLRFPRSFLQKPLLFVYTRNDGNKTIRQFDESLKSFGFYKFTSKKPIISRHTGSNHSISSSAFRRGLLGGPGRLSLPCPSGDFLQQRWVRSKPQWPRLQLIHRTWHWPGTISSTWPHWSRVVLPSLLIGWSLTWPDGDHFLEKRSQAVGQLVGIHLHRRFDCKRLLTWSPPTKWIHVNMEFLPLMVDDQEELHLCLHFERYSGKLSLC